MQGLQAILARKQLNFKNSARPANLQWEEADEFARYVGLKTTFVLYLYRKYGRVKVLGLRSWLKDVPHNGSLNALTIWKLKDNEKIALEKKNAAEKAQATLNLVYDGGLATVKSLTTA